MFNFVAVIIINMMLLCSYFVFIDTSLKACGHVSRFWFSLEDKRGLSLGGVDTSILHHVFFMLFIMFLSIIMLFGVILMPFLS